MNSLVNKKKMPVPRRAVFAKEAIKSLYARCLQERFPRQCAQCLGAEAASSENKKRYDGNQAYGAIQEKAYGYTAVIRR